MTCPACTRPGIAWRSTYGALAVTGCAACHARFRRLQLAELCDGYGRTHTAARLRGTVCTGPCAACDADARRVA